MKRKVVPGMMLTLLLIGMLTLAFNVQLVESSEPPETEWIKTYGRADESAEAYSVVETGDGGYAVAGYTTSFDPVVDYRDAWLVKVDASGNHQWNKTYGGDEEDGATSVVHTVNGGYAIAGYTRSYGARGEDMWLLKTDQVGNVQWNQTYGGPSHDRASSVVQTSDGGYTIAGNTWSFGAGSADFWLVKTDSAGDMQWNTTYGRPGYECMSCAVEVSDGGYALAGQAYSAFLLVKVAGPPISWEYVFEDLNRGTMLRISTDDKKFQFIAPENEFSVKKAYKMLVCERSIFIWHKDNEIKLVTFAIDTRIDFCLAYAKDMQTGDRYLLIDKPGTE